MKSALNVFIIFILRYSVAFFTTTYRGVSTLLCMKEASSPVTIPPDYRLPGAIATLGLALTAAKSGAGVPLLGIGALLAVQASRVRFEFDATCMEVKIEGENGSLKKSGENFAVGGENRWAYDTWTNWEVYPNENVPILMYFKETQTREDGQIHFFPFIMNPSMLIGEVRKRVPLNK